MFRLEKRKVYIIIVLILLIAAMLIYNCFHLSRNEGFTNPKASGLDKVDGVVYINLEDRKDRKQQILEETVKLSVKPEKLHRIAAVKIPKNGHKGCIQSHILALRMAKMNGWDTVAILEDDAELLVSKAKFNNKLDKAFNELISLPVWDVLLLSTANKAIDKEDSKKYKFLDRITYSTTSACYIVKKHYFDILIDLFEECNNNMTVEKWGTDNKHEPYALDQKWNELIKKDKWFAPKGDNLIFQRAVASSINSNKERGL